MGGVEGLVALSARSMARSGRSRTKPHLVPVRPVSPFGPSAYGGARARGGECHHVLRLQWPSSFRSEVRFAAVVVTRFTHF